jgi:hypothetical protein
MTLFPFGVVGLAWWFATSVDTVSWGPIGVSFGLFAIFSVAAYRLFRGALKGQGNLIAQQQLRIEQQNVRIYETDLEHRREVTEVRAECDRKQALADERLFETEKR